MVKVTKLGFFLGEYRHSLTERNRIALPKRIRIEIEDYEVILALGFDECLVGFTKKMWEEMAKQPLAIPSYDSEGRLLRRRLFSQALVVELDAQGRIVIPENFLSWAKLLGKIGEEVIVLGTGDHFEIWQKDCWNVYKNKMKT